MKLACSFTVVMLLGCSLSSAQDFFYGTYYAPAPVVQTIVPMSYVTQPVVTYSVPLYTPSVVYSPPVAVVTPVSVAAPLPISPYGVAVRETVRATPFGVNYNYREIGPWGGTRYRYHVNSTPNGYVVRERFR